MDKKGNGKAAELRTRLREALDRQGMKAIELSEKTGIPKSMVSYYLSGKAVPKSDRVYLISQVLDVSEAWLLGYDVPMNRTPEQKKNDAIVDVVSRLRKDPEFFDVVSILADLPADQYASIKSLIAALGQK